MAELGQRLAQVAQTLSQVLFLDETHVADADDLVDQVLLANSNSHLVLVFHDRLYLLGRDAFRCIGCADDRRGPTRWRERLQTEVGQSFPGEGSQVLVPPVDVLEAFALYELQRLAQGE